MSKLRMLWLALCASSATVAYATNATVTWQDNSTNEAGFGIERKVNADVYKEVTRVATNTVAYVDDTPDGTVCYRIYAFNATGKSAYSNEECATIPSLPLAPSGTKVTIKIETQVEGTTVSPGK